MKKIKKYIGYALVIYLVVTIFFVPSIRGMVLKHYLCEKYDTKFSEITWVDYCNPHVAEKDVLLIFNEWYRVGYSYEYEYNGVRFVVAKNENGYYDDYQLDEIQRWCTEWLQKNVDSGIKGCFLWTGTLSNYYEKKDKDNDYVFQKTDLSDFLDYYIKDDPWAEFYYYMPEDSPKYKSQYDMGIYISKSFGQEYRSETTYTKEDVVRKIEKSEMNLWNSFYYAPDMKNDKEK